MRGFLAASLSALVFTTNQAVGSERPHPKWPVQSASAIQSIPSDRAALNPKLDIRRQFDPTQNFRAKDLVPDICKGCSS